MGVIDPVNLSATHHDPSGVLPFVLLCCSGVQAVFRHPASITITPFIPSPIASEPQIVIRTLLVCKMLLTGNALIDAFMGGGPPVPRQQHPEAKVEAILASIDSCTNIESLVSGVEIDLKSIGTGNGYNAHNNHGPQHSATHENDVEISVSGGELTLQVQLVTLAARLSRIKSLMYKERTTTSQSFAKSFFSSSNDETIACALLKSLLINDERKMLFPKLISSLHELPFETRKDVASIFNYLLVCGVAAGNDSSFEQDQASESYTRTMIAFVNYVDAYYEHIMNPIVEGHYVGNSAVTEEGKQEQEHQAQESLAESDANKNTIRQSQPVKTVDVALHCGGMLRSTLRHPKLYTNLVTEANTPKFVYPFLDFFANQQNFEVASDALETLRLIMHPGGNGISSPSISLTLPQTTVTKLEELEAMMEISAASFLNREYESLFIKRFNIKLLSAQHANYITRRVSLQILSTVLLTRTNYNVMIKYISNRSNLKTIMMLLRDSSAHITLEAFNVFKIFVANPDKPVEIVRILAENKVKLLKYLTGLHQEKEKIDGQFKDEKALVIATLQQLEL